MFKNKLKASLIHLLLSAILITLVIGSTLFFFFPKLFIGVTDFKEVATLIISIDLILGPLLTFVVFKPKKKSLKFDLAVIGAIQLSALIYGTYALYQVHPVYITFNIDRFTIVNAKDAEPEKAINNEFNISKFSVAKIAYAKMPDDPKKQNEVTLRAAYGGEDLEKREEYYESYKEYFDKILDKSLDTKQILSNKTSKKIISTFQKKYGEDLDKFAFLPLNSDTKDMIIVLDKESSEPITTLDIDPWELSKK